jgi:hypothetical protein
MSLGWRQIWLGCVVIGILICLLKKNEMQYMEDFSMFISNMFREEIAIVMFFANIYLIVW